MSVITVGIDLAKNVFAVHGVDDSRSSERRNQWRRLNGRYGERPGLSGRFGEKTRAAADGRIRRFFMSALGRRSFTES